MDKIKLNNGVYMPSMGLGVFQITDEFICETAVLNALAYGYRMIDTAACYGNERAVGNAVQKIGIDRKEIFLVSKVWIQDAGYENTKKSFAKTLENLQTDYLDLYLIHMPYGDYHGSWRAMQELYASGKVRAIGVCNFTKDRLADLILSHEIKPAVNQIELHPFCQQRELRRFMSRYNIAPMAWAPFAEGMNNIFTGEVLSGIGKKYGMTSAQVILAWLRQNGIIAIPKSVHQNRIAENIASQKFTIDKEDMAAIEQLDEMKPLILDVRSVDEVYRLHGIKFVQ